MSGHRHALAALYPRETPGIDCTGGWVGPRAGLDRCGKYRPTGIRSPDRPAHSQSPYRLSYPARNLVCTIPEFCLKGLKKITKLSDLTVGLCAVRRTGDCQHKERQ